jgi:hypothetical protein
MSQASIDALGKLIEERYKEIMDHAYGKLSTPPPMPNQKKLPPRKPLEAATFEVPVKKDFLPPKKDPRWTYPTIASDYTSSLFLHYNCIQ